MRHMLNLLLYSQQPKPLGRLDSVFLFYLKQIGSSHVLRLVVLNLKHFALIGAGLEQLSGCLPTTE